MDEEVDISHGLASCTIPGSNYFMNQSAYTKEGVSKEFFTAEAERRGGANIWLSSPQRLCGKK